MRASRIRNGASVRLISDIYLPPLDGGNSTGYNYFPAGTLFTVDHRERELDVDGFVSRNAMVTVTAADGRSISVWPHEVNLIEKDE